MKNNIIAVAIEEVGGFSAMGRLCGVSPQAVRKWRNRGKMPRTEWTGETHYATLIEEATNGGVKAEALLSVRQHRNVGRF